MKTKLFIAGMVCLLTAGGVSAFITGAAPVASTCECTPECCEDTACDASTCDWSSCH